MTVLGLTGPATVRWWVCVGLEKFHQPCCGMWLRRPGDLHRNIQLQLPGGHHSFSCGCWLYVHPSPQPNPPQILHPSPQRLHRQVPSQPVPLWALLLASIGRMAHFFPAVGGEIPRTKDFHTYFSTTQYVRNISGDRIKDFMSTFILFSYVVFDTLLGTGFMWMGTRRGFCQTNEILPPLKLLTDWWVSQICKQIVWKYYDSVLLVAYAGR